MRDAGLRTDRQKRRGRVHQPRHRHECVGELIQVDGSEHHWFENRSRRLPSRSALAKVMISSAKVVK